MKRDADGGVTLSLFELWTEYDRVRAGRPTWARWPAPPLEPPSPDVLELLRYNREGWPQTRGGQDQNSGVGSAENATCTCSWK